MGEPTEESSALNGGVKGADQLPMGQKRNCPSCGTKFYDFNRTEIACPKCAATIELQFSPGDLIAQKVSEEARRIREKRAQEAREAAESEDDGFEAIDPLESDEVLDGFDIDDNDEVIEDEEEAYDESEPLEEEELES